MLVGGFGRTDLDTFESPFGVFGTLCSKHVADYHFNVDNILRMFVSFNVNNILRIVVSMLK